MALRPDYQIYGEYIDFYMDTTCEKGEVLSISTAGSGAALDHTLNVAFKATTASPDSSQVASGAKPLGFVTFDVVNIDLTKYGLNAQKAEVQVGTKVHIIKNGWVVTNRLHPAASPTAGANAYLGVSGLVHTTGFGVGGSSLIGRFLSTKDGDGFAKVEINIP